MFPEQALTPNALNPSKAPLKETRVVHLSDQDSDGPCRLLFVSRQNLSLIVKTIAPDMALIPREQFERIAKMMLSVVEDVVDDQKG